MKHLDAALSMLDPADMDAYEELIELWIWYGGDA